MISFRFTFIYIFAAAIAISSGSVVTGGAQASDLMGVCEADIARICPAVDKGRGRITACLIAYDHQLSGPCKAEVAKVRKSPAYSKFVPPALRSDMDPELEAGLRKVCTADIGRLCPGVRAGKGRILACLYARADSASKACSTAAKQIADGRMDMPED